MSDAGFVAHEAIGDAEFLAHGPRQPGMNRQSAGDSDVPQPAQKAEDRIDHVRQILTSKEGEFTVEAELKNGEAQFIVLSDNYGMETTFPAQILGQLIAAIGTQESMIKNLLQRERTVYFGNQVANLPPRLY